MKRVHLTSTLVAVLLPAVVLGGPSPAVAAPDAPPTPPPPGAVEQPAGDRGTWSVSATGPETWTVAWQAPQRLPVTTDRPTIVAADPTAGVAAGTPVGVPTVTDDGRTVEVTVTSTSEPTPDALDVVLSGELLDEGTPLDAPGPVTTTRWQDPAQQLLAVDPGRRGTLPVVVSDYERPGLRVPGMREDVEMVGHVVKPAPEAADPAHPLVVFLHGRHSWCYNPETGRTGWRWPCAGAQVPIPSHLGYDYLQRLLASQGYVTVSIAANGINAQDGNRADGGAAARSQLVQAHLDQWARWSGYRHQVDLDEVVLVGHSRGGEGVSRASLEIPLSADYRVVGQVLVGPTNFGRQTTPYVPTVTVLPSCDGDVVDLQGQSYTDLARGLATGDTAMKSSVMAVGANHNFFNTEWTPGLAAAPAFDDWDQERGHCGHRAETRLTASEQRRVGKAYVAGAVHLFADGDQDYGPMFDGSAVRVGSTGDAVVLSHMVGGGRTMRVPGERSSLTTPAGARTVLCEGTTPWSRTREPLCGRYARSTEATPHWPTADSAIPTSRALQLSWEQRGGRGGVRLGTALDLTGSEWLDLRTIVDPIVGDVAVRVRLTDEDGTSVVVGGPSGTPLPAMPTGDRWALGKHWAQTLRVQLSGLGLSRLRTVELVGASDRGRLWVLDIAAAPATLPAVPARRVPIVDLGQTKVDEGADGTHVAEVPFTVTGRVRDPAELWVYGFGGFSEDDEPVRMAVELPAGSGGGTIGWEYTGDTLDSHPRTVHQLIGHAIRDVMLRDNQGRVVVLDDDPAPEIAFRAVRPRAPEGGFATFEVTLSGPSGVESGVSLSVVRGSGGTPLRAHDVTRRWLDSWTNWRRGTDPALHELDVTHWGWIAPGETSRIIRVPIRDDGRAEPRESLTVRARTETGWRSAPVTVHVRASS